MSSPILEIRDASVVFRVPGGDIRAVDGVSLRVERRETLAVVGESGCGKTTLARAVLGLQRLSEGSIVLDGAVVEGTARGLAAKVGMVWQDPYASLDPRWQVAKSATEPVRLLKRTREAADVLHEVGLDPSLGSRYPHQLSGGQRQRVAIGRALALKPPLVVCDEPTAALDLSIRAQILNLLKDIQDASGCSFLYISHDLMTVRFLATRVAVMYLGTVVEEGPTEGIFSDPRHPYTRALLDSAPTLERLMELPEPLPGEVPDPRHLPSGCRFAPRCPRCQAVCASTSPKESMEQDRRFRCHFPLKVGQEAASPTS